MPFFLQPEAGHLEIRQEALKSQNKICARARSFQSPCRDALVSELRQGGLSKAVLKSGPIIAFFHPFPSQDRITVEDGVLSVPALALSDAGMYQCVAENKHGVIYFAAELMVLGRLAFVSPINPQIIAAKAS